MTALRVRALVASAIVGFVLTGCGGRIQDGGAIPPPSGAKPAGRAGASGKIQHVVIVIQENRSFDNIFHGYQGADTADEGKNSKGQIVRLKSLPLASYSIDHFSKDFFNACDGSPPGQNCNMDGFDLETVTGLHPPPNPQYRFVRHGDVKLYFDIAQQYVLADRMFTSNLDASFVSHQYIIAGQSRSAVDVPASNWGCGGGKSDTVATLNADRSYGPPESPCFNYQTIADELDKKGLTWRAYASSDSGAWDWMPYQAVRHIVNSPDYKTDVVTPPSQFLTDVANGQLASMTVVTPTFEDSDHGSGSTGPQWVANVVNAVGESQFWDTTTVFVFWDDWGGWYDHVPPPYLDFDGAGFRVPLIAISPYAKKKFVSHVQYEHGSMLKYVEDVFGLAPLAASDARANSFDPDCFDYTQKPRKFVPFATQMKPADFLAEPRDPRPPDDE